MRVFSCPSQYRRFVEAQLALALAEIGEDLRRRAANKLPRIHDQFIAADAGERVTIVVSEPGSVILAPATSAVHV